MTAEVDKVQLFCSHNHLTFPQMRKMNWDEMAQYLVKCLTGVWQAKFYNIRCIANLVAGLISHHVCCL